MTNQAETNQADALLATLQQQIVDAMQNFRAGKPTDVAALETTTQQLITEVEKLPVDSGAHYMREFQNISSVLAEFLQFLQQQQDVLQQNVAILNDNKKAHSSYKMTQASTPIQPSPLKEEGSHSE